MSIDQLKKLAFLIRYYILMSTTAAGSGHPTSSLSATDLMTALLFSGFYRFDFDHPDHFFNDRLVFSKGHASPLFYSLYLAAGVLTEEELLTLRKFDSRLEGHPTPRFPYTEAATGSLGQGLSVGVGLALGQKSHVKTYASVLKSKKSDSSSSQSQKPYSPDPKTFVLLGDGEMAEGSVWEAAAIASYYKLDNLVAIADVNRLGQSQETMLGWDTDGYKKRFEAFGWDAVVIDGHDYTAILNAYNYALARAGKPRPVAVIARTVKGKGVPLLENQDNWHGKPLSGEQLKAVLHDLGDVDRTVRGRIEKPVIAYEKPMKLPKNDKEMPSYQIGESVATRKAYGTGLARLGEVYPSVVVLDAEVKNSTFAEIFKSRFPSRFFEMFIAEQNMVGTAVGLSRFGFTPFVSSFACFLTRAFDQIRMAALSGSNVKFVGSHAGVSIGEDGPSQMGLEDLSMFRSVQGSTVVYPSDAVATEKLIEEFIRTPGVGYMRTSRPATPVIYKNDEKFPIGGMKVHGVKNPNDKVKSPNKSKKNKEKYPYSALVIAAGVTLYEAFKAQEELAKENVYIKVIDCYSIKPIDTEGLQKLTKEIYSEMYKETKKTVPVVTVEDHWYDGGLGDAVLNVFAHEPTVSVYKLAVSKMPRSGKPAELMAYEEIDSASIMKTVKKLV